MKTLLIRVLPLLALIAFSLPLQAQIETITGAQVSQANYLGQTGEIRHKLQIQRSVDAARKKRLKKKHGKSHFEGPDNFDGSVPMKINNPDALPHGIDPVRQAFTLTSVVIPVEPDLNFEGISSGESGSVPPDTNGDVSPDYYVQAVNGGGSLFEVFDKEGNSIAGPINMNTLWTDFNMEGLGDPIILWDQGAERWLFSEIASDFASLLIAVSETSDPLGNFNAYSFQALDLPDYPKYGIWPDAYYITVNDPGGTEIPVYMLDRQAMLDGDTDVELQRVGIPKFADATGGAFQVATAADWDGFQSPPPPGSPNYLVRIYDDAWDGGVDRLEVWEVSVDLDNPNNTTLTGPIDLPTEPFDSDVCQGSIFNCLTDPQGNTVSALMQVVMHRVQYRNFGIYETMVLNHVVDVDGNNLAGVRWYELRKPNGGEWSIYQQGTVSPDNNNRWMASIAMDGAGNIGLGYTIMGPDNTYDLAYTGRRASDPLGQMTINEFIFAEGLSLNLFVRWGDYSMMSVDEEDARTFWYTGEYMGENNDWATRIVTFSLQRDTIDVAPISIITPTTSAFLTNSEVVEVQVKNFGLEEQVNFDVGLILDDVFIDAQTLTDTLKPDSVVNVVFANTVDLSAIGDYNFKIYTNLNGDQNILNDTLRSVISQLTRFDAAISDISGLDGAICDSVTQAGIIIKNEGQEVLTSATIEWIFNGATPQTIDWTGSLAFGESETVFIDLEPLMDGDNTLEASISLPNGMTDEGMSNDSFSRTFQAVLGGGFIQLTLLTDSYPEETTWQLEDEGGNILFEGGPYTGEQTEYIEQWCLADACYTFRIFDSYGDGIQFGGVEGNYTITDENGIVLASLIEPNFGIEEANEFCSPFECMLTGAATTINESADGATDGAINITEANGTAPFQYSVDGGSNFSNNSFFGGLEGGVYNIVIVDANNCIAEFEVTVETCALSVATEVVNTVEGQNIGSITITADNGTAPFEYSINGGPFQSSNVFENLGANTYTVTIRDAIGCETNVNVIVNATTSTQEHIYGNAIEVFPNPTEGKFRINVTGVNVPLMNIRMIDSSGKLIQRQKLVRYGDQLTGFLSLRNFPAGIYFVEFDHKDINRMVKIVRM